jgi:hypothetical protein
MAHYNASANLTSVGEGYPCAKFYFSHQFPGEDLGVNCLFSVSCLHEGMIVEQFGIEFNQVRRGEMHEREAFTRALNVDSVRIDRVVVTYHRPGDGANVLLLEEKPNALFKMKGGCFVATAIFQDADHPTVSKLRAWRDQCLSRRQIGRVITASYDLVGPFAAKCVARFPRARPFMQRVLTRFANYVVP